MAKDFRDKGIPLLRLKGVEGDYVTLEGCNYLDPEMVDRKWSHFRVEVGDLLISTSASLGRVSVVTNESAGGVPYTGLIRFKPKDQRLLAGYLKAFLGSSAFVEQAESMASGSVIRHFGPSHIRQMAILLPPLAQQAAIGQIESLLDERLRLLRQTNATLESIAQALFKSWFIDFDPVRAKAAGREPEGMDAATAALFPAELEESALGLIPKGWRAGTFGELAQLAKGSVDPSSAPDALFEHYSLPAYDAGKLPLFEPGESIKSNKTRMPAGAVLQSKLNPHIPRVWFPSRVGDGAVCSTEFLPWMAKPGASAEVVYCTLTSAAFEVAVRTLVTGTSNSHQRVKPDQVASLPLTLPPTVLNETFTRIVRPLLDKVGENLLAGRTLSDLRDTLLPRLISGKLRLPEVQEQLDEATA